MGCVRGDFAIRMKCKAGIPIQLFEALVGVHSSRHWAAAEHDTWGTRVEANKAGGDLAADCSRTNYLSADCY
jgi:hypothetical protein